MSTDNQYFILIKKPNYPSHISAGQICYMPVYKFRSQLQLHVVSSHSSHKLSVFFLKSRSSIDYDVDVSCLEELVLEEAELLQALPDDAERLKWFMERDALQRALGLKEGTEVIVDKDGEKLRGVIRYIGGLTEPSPYSCPFPGTFFGIELQGPDKGKGNTDGSYNFKSHFSCPKDCGIFVPFTRVRPVVSSSLSPSIPEPSTQSEKLAPGDRVTYFINDKDRHGMVLEVQERHGEYIVRISTDQDENGKTGGEVEFPLQSVFKEEVPSEPERMDIDTPPLEQSVDNHFLDINSLVEVTLGEGNSYGIIRWIGTLPERKDLMAGLELEEDKGVSDGTFKSQRFFSCPPKRALFVKLASCRPDSRFQSPTVSHGESMLKPLDTEKESWHSTGKLETVPPISTEQVKEILIGRMRGIQGHCNSCYMDAALFSLFSCSSVLDSMLFKSTEPQDAPIQSTLLHDIVNPLRTNGFVDGRHIMKLRQQLQKHGYSHSFTTDEKDPEEFLTVIMHHILALEPLLKLSAAGKVQESYCYQIFLDQEHSLVLPTVQQLLEHSFYSSGLKLAEIHTHPQRQSHQRAPLKIPKGYLARGNHQALTRDKLELFAVLCIETSHYVSFIKYGPNTQDWIFFDSMADRKGEQDGYNIPEVHACPEVGTYLEMSQAELAAQTEAIHPDCALVFQHMMAQEECNQILKEEENNNSTRAGCPTLWDDIRCWYRAEVGQVVNISCVNVSHLFANNQGYIYRNCTKDGWSKLYPSYEEACEFTDYEEPEPMTTYFSNFKQVYTAGYATSLISLISAIFVFTVFRKFHCTRNYIHINLFVSFILRASAVFIKDGVLFYDENLDHCFMSTTSCKAAVAFFQFSILANYFWLLVEGMYLQTLLALTFVFQKKYFWWYILIGWGLPTTIITAWILTRNFYDNKGCWDDTDVAFIWWIIKAPITASLLVNFIIFINVIRILVQKLRSPGVGGNDTSHFKRLAKSTLLLIPLFGMHYMVFAFLPENTWNRGPNLHRARSGILSAGPHNTVAITAIEITMATEILPESKAVEKLEEEEEEEGWRDRGRENEKEGWGLS
ncbi:Pituitary adenylate cyclase-activating polypeptide type I receptor [Nibea albiflora]|uniref:Pituitary adenylate cyclase-activating polypeptide type I receptor n=1 Tax=Nibea albiflora TaxID=240163 RepID=A0ACB7EP29_NIBAL|nr:Pituitary adenylate cyclase-activating polypeptide type I receptor [Nibea albiflora]